MPTILFRVNLETVDNLSSSLPYTQAESANFKSTRSTWFPDRLIDNRKLKNGDTFTLSGLNAIYLRDNYSIGRFKFLDIVSSVP